MRAFGDDSQQVAAIAEKVHVGMQRQGVITAYKHFPGHGSTAVDSHTGLPCVNRTRQEAYAVDIAPYKQAIANQSAPNMIMTAHIQYPALDSQQISTLNGDRITVPATMSRVIQTDILRKELGFSGLTISDALNMGAITQHFSCEQATTHLFKAGVDIALMPICIASPADAHRLPELIDYVARQVAAGAIDEADINDSCERILSLKQQHFLCENAQQTRVIPTIAAGVDLQKEIADQAITLVINQQAILPLLDKTQRYYIVTPWDEQAHGIAEVMRQAGYQCVTTANSSTQTATEIQQGISNCDVFLMGTMSTQFTPVEKTGGNEEGQPYQTVASRHHGWLQFAAEQAKKRVHLSLRAPYDIVDYADHVEAAVASYAYLGYQGGVWRSPALQSLAEVLTGVRAPKGKLPVNLWLDHDVKTGEGKVAYPRGFGLNWG